MAIVWGLDLHEIKWSKFKSSYMWNTEYHLRRTKFIIYQCAMIFCVVSESLGTAALSDYVKQQSFVQRMNNNALLYNDDYIGIASYNIFAGIFVATIFGAAFFFDLFWPERHESKSVRLAWKICGVLSSVMILADALALTVITATHSASVSGISAAESQQLLAASNGGPLIYKHNGRAIASVVFIWPGFVFTVVSCVILFRSQMHDDKLGPFSTHVRTQRGIKRDVDGPTDLESGTPRTEGEVEKDRQLSPEPECQSAAQISTTPPQKRVSTET